MGTYPKDSIFAMLKLQDFVLGRAQPSFNGEVARVDVSSDDGPRISVAYCLKTCHVGTSMALRFVNYAILCWSQQSTDSAATSLARWRPSVPCAQGAPRKRAEDSGPMSFSRAELGTVRFGEADEVGQGGEMRSRHQAPPHGRQNHLSGRCFH